MMSTGIIPTPIRLLPLFVAQQMGSQVLQRTPEPSSVTDADPNVLQYDRVMGTKLAVVYGAGLTLLHRTLPDNGRHSAIDLACGPGHYTLCLARYLGFESVTGVDLSPGMASAAANNAAQYGLQDRVAFRQGDIRHLDDIDDDRFDLASFTGAAHHLPGGIDDVAKVLRQMDRIAKPEGLVMLMDLVRLRTADITERYVGIIGHDYIERGLPNFFDDFRNSMYAAYTPEELSQAIPTDTARSWCQLVPRGLPGAQVIFGLPQGRTELFLRDGAPWESGQGPVTKEMRGEWWFLSTTLGVARRHWVHGSG